MGNGVVRGSGQPRNLVVMVPTGKRENGGGERGQQGNDGLGSPSTVSFSSVDDRVIQAVTTMSVTEVTNPGEPGRCSPYPG